MLKLEAPSNSRVSDAVKAGVKVVACQNTMRNQKLSKEDMHPAISYAPAGVTEIMRLQRAGWSYIRP
jgi:intracellular sulfur oxidation DsrE/DsrF family protein